MWSINFSANLLGDLCHFSDLLSGEAGVGFFTRLELSLRIDLSSLERRSPVVVDDFPLVLAAAEELLDSVLDRPQLGHGLPGSLGELIGEQAFCSEVADELFGSHTLDLAV